MEIKDYYKILGVERTASTEEIRKAYIKLIHKYHPDRFPGDIRILKKFQDITESYKILGNLDNRLKYSMILNKKIKLPKYIDLDEPKRSNK